MPDGETQGYVIKLHVCTPMCAHAHFISMCMNAQGDSVRWKVLLGNKAAF